ncbi:MAG: Gfo/Idh/MocA family oxidoreductase [Rhodospirillales bacterium]|nr:Gfo/Idh/MocA family oxidoreductase [Rhodospirillales bacterium]
MTAARLRIGVAGAGYFGRFHALKVAASPRAVLSGITDPDPARAAALAQEAGAPALGWQALLAASDAIVVAAPAEAHFELADAALAAGRHVLVEKPIAATLDQADRLAARAAAAGRVLQVGHLLRYTAEYQAITARMRRPVYIECVRIAPFKPRGTDVSVILDLMIHDLDLALLLVDSELDGVDAMGMAVASPLDDIANARLRFRNGCVVSITASRISLRTERKMRLFSQEGYMTVDFTTRRLTMIGREPGAGMPVPGMPGAVMEEVSWTDHDALAAEHAAFVAAVLDGAPVAVDAAAGRRALAAALAVMAALADSRAKAKAFGLIQA